MAKRIDLERRAAGLLPESLRRRFERADATVAEFLKDHGITVMRVALGLVFVWFGALKVVGRSPVEELVTSTVYWLPASEFVVFLGFWEIVVGLGLILPLVLRLTLLLFWAQMAGTFLILVARPGLSFQDGNPLLLTTEGEFLIKNLVLISAGLVIGSTVRGRQKSERRGAS